MTAGLNWHRRIACWRRVIESGMSEQSYVGGTNATSLSTCARTPRCGNKTTARDSHAQHNFPPGEPPPRTTSAHVQLQAAADPPLARLHTLTDAVAVLVSATLDRLGPPHFTHLAAAPRPFLPTCSVCLQRPRPAHTLFHHFYLPFNPPSGFASLGLVSVQLVRCKHAVLTAPTPRRLAICPRLLRRPAQRRCVNASTSLHRDAFTS